MALWAIELMKKGVTMRMQGTEMGLGGECACVRACVRGRLFARAHACVCVASGAGRAPYIDHPANAMPNSR